MDMTMNNLSDYLKSAMHGIDGFLQKYTKNDSCMDYIYECDIQAELYTHMKDSLHASDLLRSPESWTVCVHHKTTSDAVQLLHCEQNIRYEKDNGKKYHRIDVALWDPTYPENPVVNFKRKRCMLLVEIKHRCKAESALEQLVKDFSKFKKWNLDKKQVAIALAFCTELKTQSSLYKSEIIEIKNLESTVALGSQYGVLVCKDGFLRLGEK
jgi:hypothetical protein